MIYFIGCERARGMLDAYVDGELAIADQVVVETHLRSCATCRNCVDDLRRIGASLRVGSPARQSTDYERMLAGLHAGTIARQRVERDQAVRARVREAFADMRLLWPALGALSAVVVGVGLAMGLLWTGSGNPGSLTGLIQRTINNWHIVHSIDAGLGSERQPLQFDRAMFRPQVIDSNSAAFDELPGEFIFAFHSVVGRDGTILALEGPESSAPAALRTASYDAVRDAVSGFRFAPALASDGSGVAVEMVMYVSKMTVTYSEPVAPPAPRRAAAAPLPQPPVVVQADTPAPALADEEASVEAEDGFECQECSESEDPTSPELRLWESEIDVPVLPALRSVVA